MKVSTEISSAAAIIGEERAVEAIAEAGFDAWDFSMFAMCKCDWAKNVLLPNDHPLAGPDYLKFARRLRKIGEDNGIHCNQSHAPFPSRCIELRGYFKRAIECTAEAGGKICVIHPEADYTPEQNAQMYREYLPYAKECGVKIAVENMYRWIPEADHSIFAACATAESFLKHLEAVNDESFVACLDIGHAEMRGSGEGAAKTVRALGRHLQALHIHDNDLKHDSHQIPFSMQIDFLPILRALKEIGYPGDFTLEASNYLSNYTADDVKVGIEKLYESARRLADLYEAL